MIICTSVSVILLFADSVCVHCSCNNLNTGKQQNKSATLPLQSEYACALFGKGILCNEKGVFLAISNCLIYSEDTKTITLAQCPYFDIQGYDVTNTTVGCVSTFSTKIPGNLSELNDFMCGPLKKERFTM